MDSSNVSNSQQKEYRILLFGTTSVGKTSLINLLTNSQEPVGNNGTKGCTFQHKDIFCIKEGCKFIFTDTVGLDEARNGTVDSFEAISNLIQLIKKAKLGFHLAIYVRKCGVVTCLDENNYELIIEGVFQNKIKTIVVNSHAENEAGDGKSMNFWWNKNKDDIQRPNFKFDGGCSVCLCDKHSNPMIERIIKENDYVKQSVSLLWENIENCKSQDPTTISNGVSAIFVKLWNKLVDFVNKLTGLGSKFQIRDGKVEEALKKSGMPDDKVKDLARQLKETK